MVIRTLYLSPFNLNCTCDLPQLRTLRMVAVMWLLLLERRNLC